MLQKHRYSAKEHRQVEHIKESDDGVRGLSAGEAEGVGYATVNKPNPDAHRYTAKENAKPRTSWNPKKPPINTQRL